MRFIATEKRLTYITILCMIASHAVAIPITDTTNNSNSRKFYYSFDAGYVNSTIYGGYVENEKYLSSLGYGDAKVINNQGLFFSASIYGQIYKKLYARTGLTLQQKGGAIKNTGTSYPPLVGIKVQLEVPIAESEEFIEESIRKQMIKHCRKTLKAVSEDINKIENEIDELVKGDERLNAQMQWATSVPGIGKITAMHMIISTGEFERISESKKFACYSGVAPFKHTSGTSVRGRTRVSKLANMTMKKLLHLAAMSAIQCCEELKAFYQRKVAEGKNKMSVINAVRNKLISRVFSCIKNKRMYQKVYQHALA